MANDKIQQYFKDYPNSDEVFETADGYLFHKQHDAATQANTLKDKRVVKHERKRAKAEATPEPQDAEVGSEEDVEQPEPADKTTLNSPTVAKGKKK